MGLPRFHEQPVLLLMYRTIQNYEFIEQKKDHNGPFEVTQLINSFLALVAHPWDQLLDKNKLGFGIDSRVFKDCGFPSFPRLAVEGTPANIDTAYELLRVLRNSMAHGNMELLDRKALRKLRQTGPLARVAETEIAGLELWNQNDGGIVTWRTALSIYELQQVLNGMMRLCEKRSLWKDEIRLDQDRRDAERRTGRIG